MSRGTFVLSFLLVSFSLVGFGCKERPDPNTKAPGAVSIATPKRFEDIPNNKPSKPENVASPEIRQLRQILTNLAKAKSYRITTNLPSTAGSATGVLQFSRERGILAQLKTATSGSELFIKGNNLWVRYATNTWQSVPTSEETKRIIDQMKTAFAFQEDGTSSIFLRDSAKILEKTEDRSGCTLYKVEQKFYVPVERTQTIELCVTSSYPKSIRINDGGQITSMSYEAFDDESILATSPLTQ